MRAIFEKFFRKRDKVKSLKGYLYSVLPRRVVERLYLVTPDRRLLPERAAAELGLSLDEFYKRFSDYSSYPFIPLLPPANFNEVSLPFNKEEMADLGFIPLVTSNIIGGIASVDPSFLEPVKERLPKAPLYLATWPKIRRVLSKGLPKEDSFKEEHEPEVGWSIIENLIKKLESAYGIRNAVIKCEARRVSYHIFTGTAPGTGEIKNTYYPAIFQALSGVADKVPRFVASGGGEKSKLFVGRINEKEFSLNWQSFSPKEVVPERKEEVVKEPLREESEAKRMRRILLIEDKCDFAKLFKRMFLQNGIEIIHEPNGRLALDYLTIDGSKVEAIVCDINMPVMNGFEFLIAVRALKEFSSIPIAMFTSDETPETEIKALNYGADVVIKKAEKPAVFLAQVKRLLEQRESQRAA